jgi:hypothetical protein
MRSLATCPRHHRSSREVRRDDTHASISSMFSVHGGGRARDRTRLGERRACAAADAPCAAHANAATSGDDRDSRAGTDATGRHGATARDAGIQPARARARLLRSRLLAIDPASARDRLAEWCTARRFDLAVYGRLHVSCPPNDSPSVGHASCSSETVRTSASRLPATPTDSRRSATGRARSRTFRSLGDC